MPLVFKVTERPGEKFGSALIFHALTGVGDQFCESHRERICQFLVRSEVRKLADYALTEGFVSLEVFRKNPVKSRESVLM